MRHTVPFPFSKLLLAASAIFLVSCAVPRTAQRFDVRDVQQIRVYDWRPQTRAADHFVTAIEARDKVGQIVDLLGRYEEGWVPVRVTVATGYLVLDCMSNGNPEKDKWPMAQFRISPRSIGTYIDGKPYSQEMTRADQIRLCRIIGLEESFFSEASPAHDVPGTERKGSSPNQ